MPSPENTDELSWECRSKGAISLIWSKRRVREDGGFRQTMLHYTAADVISVSHGHEFRLDAAVPDEHPVWKSGALSEPRICGGGALGHRNTPTEDQSY